MSSALIVLLIISIFIVFLTQILKQDVLGRVAEWVKVLHSESEGSWLTQPRYEAPSDSWIEFATKVRLTLGE